MQRIKPEKSASRNGPVSNIADRAQVRFILFRYSQEMKHDRDSAAQLFSQNTHHNPIFILAIRVSQVKPFRSSQPDHEALCLKIRARCFAFLLSYATKYTRTFYPASCMLTSGITKSVYQPVSNLIRMQEAAHIPTNILFGSMASVKTSRLMTMTAVPMMALNAGRGRVRTKSLNMYVDYNQAGVHIGCAKKAHVRVLAKQWLCCLRVSRCELEVELSCCGLDGLMFLDMRRQ